MIAICENNLYAVETPTVNVTGGGDMVRRAEGFGVHAEAVDGQDIFEVYRAASAARSRALSGEGPSFIEARTYRYSGHGSGEGVGAYRTADEISSWRTSRDPIERLALQLTQAGYLKEGQLEALDAEAVATVDEALRFAEESPWP
jgi:pyruvate dehydrogenase E1 component alpha subunit